MEFQAWHRYFRLMRRNIIPPLLCQHDQHELSLMSKDDKPVLRCWFCNTTTLPGQNMYDKIEAVVKEHYV